MKAAAYRQANKGRNSGIFPEILPIIQAPEYIPETPARSSTGSGHDKARRKPDPEPGAYPGQIQSTAGGSRSHFRRVQRRQLEGSTESGAPSGTKRPAFLPYRHTQREPPEHLGAALIIFFKGKTSEKFVHRLIYSTFAVPNMKMYEIQ